jgi:hypothetical protein
MGGALGYAGYLSLRSLLGVTVGGVAAKGAGALNKITFDRSTKQDYRNEVRNTGVETVLELETQQRAEKHGSRNARQKREQVIKVGTAAVVGGLTSFELGQFAHLTSVQHAISTHQHTPIVPEHPKGPVATGEKLQMQIGGKNAEGVTINNADRLFGHFGLMLQRDFAHGAHPPAAIDTYLKALTPHNGGSLLRGEDHFSKVFGFEGKYSLREVMHNGDTIKFTNNGTVVIDWADHTRPSHILINPDGSKNLDISDITKHLKAVQEHGQQRLSDAVGRARAAATPETFPTEVHGTGAVANSDHADVGLNNAEHQADLQQHEPTAPEVAQPQISSAEAPQTEILHQTPEVVSPPNISNDYNPALYGGYEMQNSAKDASDLLFYYNPSDAHFMERLQEFARQHPGREIKFDSPEPIVTNGESHPWISTAVFDPRSGFTAQTFPSPEYVDTQINPSMLTKRIQ